MPPGPDAAGAASSADTDAAGYAVTRALAKVHAWRQALAGMASGELQVGSRTPLRNDFVNEVGWRVIPQIHAQVNHHLRVQVGLGVQGDGPTPHVVGAGRIIGEL